MILYAYTVTVLFQKGIACNFKGRGFHAYTITIQLSKRGQAKGQPDILLCLKRRKHQEKGKKCPVVLQNAKPTARQYEDHLAVGAVRRAI